MNHHSHPLEGLSLGVARSPRWVTVTEHRGHDALVQTDSVVELSLSFTTRPELEAGTEDSLILHILSGERVVARHVVSLVVAVPREFLLSQNYPNPFNPSTRIRYQLPEESRVKFQVFDVLGRDVVRLVDEEKPAGYFEVEWDGRSALGSVVSSGVYFYRMEAHSVRSHRLFQSVRRMMVVK